MLKSMKDLSAEEKPKFGQLVNEARAEIEKALEKAKSELERARSISMNIIESTKAQSNELLDELMQDFEKNCVKSLKNQHPGKLEQMLINIYEREA